MLGKLVQAGETKELSPGNSRGARHCQRDKRLATLTLNYPLHIFRSVRSKPRCFPHLARTWRATSFAIRLPFQLFTENADVCAVRFYTRLFFVSFSCVLTSTTTEVEMTVIDPYTTNVGDYCMHILVYSYGRRKKYCTLKISPGLW